MTSIQSIQQPQQTPNNVMDVQSGLSLPPLRKLLSARIHSTIPSSKSSKLLSTSSPSHPSHSHKPSTIPPLSISMPLAEAKKSNGTHQEFALRSPHSRRTLSTSSGISVSSPRSGRSDFNDYRSPSLSPLSPRARKSGNKTKSITGSHLFNRGHDHSMPVWESAFRRNPEEMEEGGKKRVARYLQPKRKNLVEVEENLEHSDSDDDTNIILDSSSISLSTIQARDERKLQQMLEARKQFIATLPKGYLVPRVARLAAVRNQKQFSRPQNIQHIFHHHQQQQQRRAKTAEVKSLELSDGSRQALAVSSSQSDRQSAMRKKMLSSMLQRTLGNDASFLSDSSQSFKTVITPPQLPSISLQSKNESLSPSTDDSDAQVFLTCVDDHERDEFVQSQPEYALVEHEMHRPSHKDQVGQLSISSSPMHIVKRINDYYSASSASSLREFEIGGRKLIPRTSIPPNNKSLSIWESPSSQSTLNQSPSGSIRPLFGERLAESELKYDLWYGEMGSLASRLFIAKCEDVGIPPVDKHQSRFISRLVTTCRGQVLDISDANMGKKAASELSNFFKQQLKQRAREENMKKEKEKKAKLKEMGYVMDDENETVPTSFEDSMMGDGFRYGIDEDGDEDEDEDEIDDVGDESDKDESVYAPPSNTSSTTYPIVLQNNMNQPTSLRDTDIKNKPSRKLVRRNQFHRPSVPHIITPCFTTIHLGGNNLGDEGVKILTHTLLESQYPGLTDLDLNCNDVTGEGFAYVFASLAKNETLTKLNMSAFTNKGKMFIGPGLKAPRRLAEFLMTNRTLTSLNLGNCGLGLVPGAVLSLCEGISYNATLSHLDISGNALGFKDIQDLYCGLLTQMRSLKAHRERVEAEQLQEKSAMGNTTRYSKQRAHPSAMTTTAILMNFFKGGGNKTDKGVPKESDIPNNILMYGGSHLKSLNLSRNTLSSVGAAIIADLVKSEYPLQKLDLSKCSIGVAGFALLTDACSMRAHLETLILDGNYFSHKPELSYALECRSGVTNENLNDLMLKLDVVHLRNKFVSEEIARSQSLRILSLQHCGIRDDFCSHLCSALHGNTSLTSLQLSQNNLRDKGASAIATHLIQPSERTSLPKNMFNDDSDDSDDDYDSDWKNQKQEAKDKANGKMSTSSSSSNVESDESKKKASENASIMKKVKMAKKKRNARRHRGHALTVIDLGFNNIGDAGAMKIVKALEKNRTLLHLNLSNNDLGQEAADAFAHLLTTQTTLIGCNVQDNKLTYEAMQTIKDQIGRNRRVYLQTLHQKQVDRLETLMQDSILLESVTRALDAAETELATLEDRLEMLEGATPLTKENESEKTKLVHTELTKMENEKQMLLGKIREVDHDEEVRRRRINKEVDRKNNEMSKIKMEISKMEKERAYRKSKLLAYQLSVTGVAGDGTEDVVAIIKAQEEENLKKAQEELDQCVADLEKDKSEMAQVLEEVSKLVDLVTEQGKKQEKMLQKDHSGITFVSRLQRKR